MIGRGEDLARAGKEREQRRRVATRQAMRAEGGRGGASAMDFARGAPGKRGKPWYDQESLFFGSKRPSCL